MKYPYLLIIFKFVVLLTVYDLIHAEEPEIDANGCNVNLKKQFEVTCDSAYEKVENDAHLIKDDRERSEAVCCALDDYEKCILRAHDKANCIADKTSIRENIKAARLFLTITANVDCLRFRAEEQEPEIDADGCNMNLRKHFENRCNDAYEKVQNEALLIKDDRERNATVCFALDDFEKCSLKVYDRTNCAADKTSIRENLRAASLFYAVIANVDCLRFRAKEPEIDANGCNINLRKHFEDKCDDAFEKVQNEAHLIKDDRERSDAVCCALEDFEKCSRRSYAQANCTTDETSIRQNLKESRIFLTVTANIDCLRSRGQCAHNNAATPGQVYYTLVSISILVQMYLQWTY